MKVQATASQGGVALRAKQSNFWREKFKQDPSNAGFAADFAGTGASTRKSVFEPVSADLAAHLADASKGNQRVLASIMIAGLAIVAARHSGNKQVVIGAQRVKRGDDADGESEVFPLVVAASGGMTFSATMDAVADSLRSANAHLPYSFDLLAREIGRTGGAVNPFYDISVIREVRQPCFSRALAPAGINVYWAATETGKHIAASYDQTRFKESTVKTVLRSIAACLSTGLENPDRRLNGVALGDAAGNGLFAKIKVSGKESEKRYRH